MLARSKRGTAKRFSSLPAAPCRLLRSPPPPPPPPPNLKKPLPGPPLHPPHTAGRPPEKNGVGFFH